MQLEKATSRSSEAALAGWISSNDVTLFTTVLVVVIAMFLHARLSKGAKENVQISAEKQLLAADLKSTASELDASNDLLEQTRQALNLTQEQRDQLRQRFDEKLEAIAQLNAKLDLILHEKGQLESEHRSLTEAKESLSQEQTKLMSQRAALTTERDALRTSNTSLQERLETLSGQLAEKIAALEQLAEQRDRLKKQADELDAIVAGLKQKMHELNIDLADTQARAAAAHEESAAKVQELEVQLADRDKQAEEYLADLKRAAELFNGLKAEKEQLQHALTEAELQYQAQLIEEGRHNRELLELNGKLERVAILFDASGSMRQAGASGGIDRWEEAQRIAATWLEHINVQQCVLIVFASDVRTFPEDGSLADLRGEAGKSKREALLQRVKEVSPVGATNTLDALRKAYEYDVDTILLFSDGAPSPPNAGVFDPAIARQIYDLCRAHRNVPIHTIGLGNYFDQNASTFLLSVAKITGGTFRGK
jgi:chromosome segregation ATPase